MQLLQQRMLHEHWNAGEKVEQVARVFPDEVVDACFVAGTADEVAEGLQPVLTAAEEQGIDQVLLSKLGPRLRQSYPAVKHARALGDGPLIALG
jgi:hypothetical protein